MTNATDKNIFQKLTTVDPLTITFTLSPTDVSYANTLRRAILTEVETVGFRSDILEDGKTSDVTVFKNNTPMTNEMLADRIGLIPLYADAKEWKEKELKTMYTFELKKKSESENPLDVYAHDFIVRVGNEDEENTNNTVRNTQFFHSDPYMQSFRSGELYTPLITTLKGLQPNQVPQEVHLVAQASVGRGRDHVRFSPVSQCSYKYTINTDEEAQKIVFNNWLTKTKKVAIDFSKEDSEKGGKREKLWREFQTMEVERCFLKDEATDMPYSYDFTIETKGQMECALIVQRAIEAMIDKCRKYSTIGNGDLPENIVSIVPADWVGIGFDMIIKGEDHTLGNLLQTWLDANKMTDGKGGEGEITFVGYKIPHPLRDEMVFRIGFPQFLDQAKQKRPTELTTRAIFAEAARGCMKIFEDWLVMWNAAVNKQPVTKTPINTRARLPLKVAKTAPAAPVKVEEVAGKPETISKEQPPVKKQDARRGTFWQKDPLA